MKYFLGVLSGILILAGIWFFGRQEQPQVQTRPTVTINGYELEIEIARTPEEQTRGLSGRGSLAENAGMLFVYENSLTPGFWMKEMNFPIDIIWISSDHKVIDITENIAPETFPQVFYPSLPVQYVLEVNAGWAESHNTKIGDAVTFQNGVF